MYFVKSAKVLEKWRTMGLKLVLVVEAMGSLRFLMFILSALKREYVKRLKDSKVQSMKVLTYVKMVVYGMGLNIRKNNKWNFH
jgi:hypothetical protein